MKLDLELSNTSWCCRYVFLQDYSMMYRELCLQQERKVGRPYALKYALFITILHTRRSNIVRGMRWFFQRYKVALLAVVLTSIKEGKFTLPIVEFKSPRPTIFRGWVHISRHSSRSVSVYWLKSRHNIQNAGIASSLSARAECPWKFPGPNSDEPESQESQLCSFASL